MNNKEKLLTDIKNDDSVKRCHELERMIDENKEIKSLLNKKKHISKEMVAARHIGLTNTYNDYKRQYDEIDKEIAKYPFVNEYLELLDYLYNDLEIMTDYITSKINKELEN